MKQTFNDLTLDELVARREELTGKLRNLRFEMVMGHVENPLEKRNLRRQIARLNTMINEHEIGIRKA
jgi:large subunit ribosomal protein L29